MLLNCHSYYSLRYGTIPIQRLVQLGEQHHISTMALTDINNLSGVYEFMTACKAKSIKPVIGTEIRTENELHYILLAKNQEGFSEIGQFLTIINQGNTTISSSAPDFQNCFVIYPFSSVSHSLKEWEYIGVRSNQLSLLYAEKWKPLMNKLIALHTVNHLNEENINYTVFYEL